MSVFAIYDSNEYGDIVPTGGVFVSSDILNMVFQEDVEIQLQNMNLEKMLYEEALSAWIGYRKDLIDLEKKEWQDMIEQYGEYQLADDFDIPYKMEKKLRKDCSKRGQNSTKRHYEHEKRKKNKIRIVENNA
jgi:hypothetical protein